MVFSHTNRTGPLTFSRRLLFSVPALPANTQPSLGFKDLIKVLPIPTNTSLISSVILPKRKRKELCYVSVNSFAVEPLRVGLTLLSHHQTRPPKQSFQVLCPSGMPGCLFPLLVKVILKYQKSKKKQFQGFNELKFNRRFKDTKIELTSTIHVKVAIFLHFSISTFGGKYNIWLSKTQQRRNEELKQVPCL